MNKELLLRHIDWLEEEYKKAETKARETACPSHLHEASEVYKLLEDAKNEAFHIVAGENND